jgi:hypothetical protein
MGYTRLGLWRRMRGASVSKRDATRLAPEDYRIWKAGSDRIEAIAAEANARVASVNDLVSGLLAEYAVGPRDRVEPDGAIVRYVPPETPETPETLE